MPFARELKVILASSLLRSYVLAAGDAVPENFTLPSDPVTFAETLFIV